MTTGAESLASKVYEEIKSLEKPKNEKEEVEYLNKIITAVNRVGKTDLKGIDAIRSLANTLIQEMGESFGGSQEFSPLAQLISNLSISKILSFGIRADLKCVAKGSVGKFARLKTYLLEAVKSIKRYFGKEAIPDKRLNECIEEIGKVKEGKEGIRHLNEALVILQKNCKEAAAKRFIGKLIVASSAEVVSNVAGVVESAPPLTERGGAEEQQILSTPTGQGEEGEVSTSSAHPVVSVSVSGEETIEGLLTEGLIEMAKNKIGQFFVGTKEKAHIAKDQNFYNAYSIGGKIAYLLASLQAMQVPKVEGGSVKEFENKAKFICNEIVRLLNEDEGKAISVENRNFITKNLENMEASMKETWPNLLAGINVKALAREEAKKSE